jgi:hypothetical protein
MNAIRAFAAAITLAAATGGMPAPPASAAPSMIGDYVLTETSRTTREVHATSWNVNPCGEGCIDIKAGAGSSRAQLVDGQWVIDMFDNVRCPDGSRVPYAANAHLTWDANTLEGTDQLVYTQPACGQPAGYAQINDVKIKRS